MSYARLMVRPVRGQVRGIKGNTVCIYICTYDTNIPVCICVCTYVCTYGTCPESTLPENVLETT